MERRPPCPRRTGNREPARDAVHPAPGAQRLAVRAPGHLDVPVGAPVQLLIAPQDLHVFDADGRRIDTADSPHPVEAARTISSLTS